MGPDRSAMPVLHNVSVSLQRNTVEATDLVDCSCICHSATATLEEALKEQETLSP